ncbi:hypothetical protein ACFYM5_38100 [Streptomyces sp. NPDC006706]|uniref:hypothetical protein n=1 Tax=Streptomyces sp. NPDC006706 TaxID=3364761 RepID=UPI00368BA2EF
MSDTTETEPRQVQLAPAWVDEIRGLVQWLTGRPDPAEVPWLLADLLTSPASGRPATPSPPLKPPG